MKKTVQLLTLLLALIMLVSCLAACNTGSNNNSGNSNTTTPNSSLTAHCQTFLLLSTNQTLVLK